MEIIPVFWSGIYSQKVSSNLIPGQIERFEYERFSKVSFQLSPLNFLTSISKTKFDYFLYLLSIYHDLQLE